jgi:hypothetical protein
MSELKNVLIKLIDNFDLILYNETYSKINSKTDSNIINLLKIVQLTQLESLRHTSDWVILDKILNEQINRKKLHDQMRHKLRESRKRIIVEDGEVLGIIDVKNYDRGMIKGFINNNKTYKTWIIVNKQGHVINGFDDIYINMRNNNNVLDAVTFSVLFKGYEIVNEIDIPPSDDGMFYLDCEVEGKSFKSLYDTGSTICCLNFVGKYIDEVEVKTINGVIKTKRYESKMLINGLKEQPFIFINLPKNIIGMNMIKKWSSIIDEGLFIDDIHR